MPNYTVMAKVDCLGVYQIEAESEEEAREKFAAWDGGDSVIFSHYAEEMTDEIESVQCDE